MQQKTTQNPVRAPSEPLRRSIPLLCGVLVLAASAAAEHPVGPEFGRNRVKTRIETGPQGSDQDDYLALLAAGDLLTVKVSSPFQSPLFPGLALLDPTGADRIGETDFDDFVGTKRAAFRKYRIDRTGQWAVRVSGLLSTEGAYVASFTVTPAPRLKLRGLAISSDAYFDHEFDAVDNSTLDVALTWGKRDAPVEITALLGPDGVDVLGPDGITAGGAARTSRRASKLRRFPLTAGSGTYTLRLATADSATMRLVLGVRAPPRRRGTQKLAAPEPHITRPNLGVINGVEGMDVRIDGWYFSNGEAPVVRFGDAAGRDVIVDASGGFLHVAVPPGIDDTRVPVFVINPDGQGSVADDLFYYVPPPTITAITDLTGAPMVGASTAGGDLVRLRGTHFRTGQIVTFGGAPEIVPQLRGDEIEVRTPAREAGAVVVRLQDSFGHEAEAPTEFEFKSPPQFDATAPYSPAVAPTSGGTAILVRGSAFEATDTLLFDGVPTAMEFIGPTLLRFTPPAGMARDAEVELLDRFGLLGVGPALRVKAPAVIDSVTAVGGARIGTGQVSIHGGSLVAVGGASFHDSDVVEFAGTPVAASSATDDVLSVTAPAHAAGLVDVAVRDDAGQRTQEDGALRFVGFANRTSARVPARSNVDDWSALRGVAADLDGDGDDDDVVLVSHTSSPGSRSERTRIAIGNASGLLVDRTSADFATVGDDDSGADDWRATDVAVGDLDGQNGVDIVIVGPSPDSTRYSDVRVFVNDGSGAFSFADGDVPDTPHTTRTFAVDENDVEHEIQSARSRLSVAGCIAMGDVDGDGDLDVVVGRDRYESVDLGLDPAVVNFTVSPAYVSAAVAANSANDRDVSLYASATRIYENRIGAGGGLVDVTTDALPSVGDSDATPRPAFHARDLALADLDDDGDLDLVIVWHDPTTVTPKGLGQGSGSTSPRAATLILENDGSGAFTDVTSDWLPSTSAPEFFQASRVVVTDLNGDALPELVLLHESGISAYQGSPGYLRRALRILRNDGKDAAGDVLGFVDVSDTALPAVTLATNDNLRGTGLVVADLTADGVVDILIATDVAPVVIGETTRLPSTRLLVGSSTGLSFDLATGFVPALATDSGEADDVVLVPDLAPDGRPCVLRLSETLPTTSPSSSYLRAIDWER